MPADPRDPPYRREDFARTRYTLLATAVDDLPARAELCNRYAAAVYTVVDGRLGRRPDPDEALDRTHGFLSHFFLEPPYRFAAYLAGPEAGRGTFRSYVVTAVGRFLTDQYRRETTLRRGGGRVRVELDADPARYEGLFASRECAPEFKAEVVYTLGLVCRAAGEVARQVAGPPAGGVERALDDDRRAGREPDIPALARRFRVDPKTVRDRWAAVRARTALAGFLSDPPPPGALQGLAADLGMEPDTLYAQFSRLRGEVRDEFVRLLQDEAPAALDPRAVAAGAMAEADRLLELVDWLAENPGDW